METATPQHMADGKVDCLAESLVDSTDDVDDEAEVEADVEFEYEEEDDDESGRADEFVADLGDVMGDEVEMQADSFANNGQVAVTFDDQNSPSNIITDLVRDSTTGLSRPKQAAVDSEPSYSSDECRADDDEKEDGRHDRQEGENRDVSDDSVAGGQTRGDPTRLPGADAASYIDPDFLRPFFFGWRREVHVPRVSRDDSHLPAKIFYLPPNEKVHTRRKRKSRMDQERYFEEQPSKVLSAINFCYQTRPLGLNNEAYESIIDENSIANSVKQQAKTDSDAITTNDGSTNSTAANPEGRRRLRDRSLLVSRSRYGVQGSTSGSASGGQAGSAKPGTVAATRLLWHEDNDVHVYRRFIVGTTLIDQISRGSARLRYEHRKRRDVTLQATQYSDEPQHQRPSTPPRASDLSWTPCYSDDPLGIFTRIWTADSSSPAPERPQTPPPLRAVRLMPVGTAQAVRKAMDEVKALAIKRPATEMATKVEEEETEEKKEEDEQMLYDLDLIDDDIPEAGLGSSAHLASHDVLIRKFKNYAAPPSSYSLANGGMGVGRTGQAAVSAFQAALISRMLVQKQQQAALAANQRPGQTNAKRLAQTLTISLSLPMDAPQVKGVRPLVDIVILNDAGRYQPVRFARAFKITESIPRWRFDEADRLQRPVYVRAKSITSIRQRPLMLAVNPACRSAGRLSVTGLIASIRAGKISGYVSGNDIQSRPVSNFPTRTNQLSRQVPTMKPTSMSARLVAASQQMRRQQNRTQQSAATGSSSTLDSAEMNKMKDQVAILVRPFNVDSQGQQVAANCWPTSSSTRLLNIPKRIIPRLKVGLTLSFSSATNQKYTVVDTKLYPAVKPVTSQQSNGHHQRKPNQPASAADRRPEVFSRIGNSVSITPSSASAGKVAGAAAGKLGLASSSLSSAAAQRLASFQQQAAHRGAGGGGGSNANSRQLQGSKALKVGDWQHQQQQQHQQQRQKQNPPVMTRKIPASVSVSPSSQSSNAREKMPMCTPFCPGAAGPPDLVCKTCQTVFHGTCLGFNSAIVTRISNSFKCKACLATPVRNPISRGAPSNAVSKPPIVIDLE